MMVLRNLSLGLLLILVFSATGAQAQSKCGGAFAPWLDEARKEALAQGISAATVSSTLTGLSPDPAVLARDRDQKVFSQTFEQFSSRMIPPRLTRGANMMKQYGSALGRIEERFGVPGGVIVAIWGLETDFGTNNGKFATIRALATLANDCRRSDMFRKELFDALRIVERGDLSPAEMRGAWAGEIGQTQFMPSSWLKYAVDFDSNGRPDLIHSVPDVLASTANFLASHGWKRGEPWTPGTPNFAALQEWNKSEIYSRTVAAFAERLDRAP